MGTGPSEEQVRLFMDITSVGRSEAVHALTREPHVETAIQKHFDTQDGGIVSQISNSEWDEDHMHAGREYGPQNNFQIHASDANQTLGPDLFKNATSRPPSRVDSKDDAKNDPGLQQVLLDSMNSSNYRANPANFGPATRSHYPDGQWGLVTTTQRVIPDSDPIHRHRKEGEPAFLKPTVDDNRLAALLTIYKQIPLAREALLVRTHVLREYGLSPDWWQGESIPAREIVVTTDDGRAVRQPTPTINEVQRLMAFLELTDRQYGNVGALREKVWSSELQSIRSNDETVPDVDADLLTIWRKEHQLLPHIDQSLKDVFVSVAREKIKGRINSESPFQIFKLALQYSSTDIETLYDVIDEILWGEWVVEEPTETFLELGDILTFQANEINLNTNGRPIEWPLVWYADRYLEENKHLATDMLYSQHQIEEARNDYAGKQCKLENVNLSGMSKQTVKAQELLKTVLPFLRAEGPPLDPQDDGDEEIASGSRYHPLEEYAKLAETLQGAADKIKSKHYELEQERQKLLVKKKDKMDYLKTLADNPKHRYTLRGLSVDDYTIYVLANSTASDDLLQMDVESWQWWKIAWDSQRTENPVDISRVEDTEVSKAASVAKDLVAIYASDKAVNYAREPVPQALKNFVEVDNLQFKAELDNPVPINQPNEDWSHLPDTAFTYNHHSSNGSIDSMTANLDAEMEDYNAQPQSHNVMPPPIPPRTGKKRSIDNIMDADIPIQQSGIIALNDDDDAPHDEEMQEIRPYGKVGDLPGGPSSGVSDSVMSSSGYPAELNMSDTPGSLYDSQASSSWPQTLEPGKLKVTNHGDSDV